MKNIKYILCCLIMLQLIYSCKDEALMYVEPDSIYFDKPGILGQADSINYSFGLKPDDFDEDTVYLNFKLTGLPVEKARTIGLSILPNSTAKENYHYRIGDLVLPANAYQVQVPVYLYRKVGLRDSTVSVEFEIIKSDDLLPGYSDYVSKYSRLRYKISLSDFVTKPTGWEQYVTPYFGSYSITKYRFMIKVTGQESIWGKNIQISERNFYIGQVKLALYEYEKAFGPMMDENGVRVLFP